MTPLAIGRLAIIVQMAPQKIIFNKLNNNDVSQNAWVTADETKFLWTLLWEWGLIWASWYLTYDTWCLLVTSQKNKDILKPGKCLVNSPAIKLLNIPGQRRVKLLVISFRMFPKFNQTIAKNLNFHVNVGGIRYLYLRFLIPREFGLNKEI